MGYNKVVFSFFLIIIAIASEKVEGTGQAQKPEQKDTSAILDALKEGFNNLGAILTNNSDNKNSGNDSPDDNSSPSKFRSDKSKPEAILPVAISDEPETMNREVRIEVICFDFESIILA